jgi:hypothetical protein
VNYDAEEPEQDVEETLGEIETGSCLYCYNLSWTFALDIFLPLKELQTCSLTKFYRVPGKNNEEEDEDEEEPTEPPLYDSADDEGIHCVRYLIDHLSDLTYGFFENASFSASYSYFLRFLWWDRNEMPLTTS